MEPIKADQPIDHAFFDLAGNPSLLDCSPCLSRQQLNKLTTMTTEQQNQLSEFLGNTAGKNAAVITHQFTN